MVEIKPAQIDQYLSGPSPRHSLVLVHGPDRGLVSERARALAGASGVDLTDDFATVKLAAADLQADPGRLADEAGTIGLFGGKRLIWVRQAGNERGLVAAVKALLEQDLDDVFVLLEGGELKKGTGLRALVERSDRAASVPCYADEGRALSRLIDEVLGAHDLEIDPAARQMLAGLLGGDRLASRSELEKLSLYALGRGRVEQQDVAAVTGDAAALSVDAAVDAVLTGDRAALDLAMRRLRASKAALFPVLQALTRQLDGLELMRARMEEDNMPLHAAVAAEGKRLHFRRKVAVEKALAIWSLSDIDRARRRLQEIILTSRQSAALGDAVVQMGLLGLTLAAARKASGASR